MTSELKAESNRRNAQKSTGPKTSGGKRRSSMNALKHGLLAQAVLIERGFSAEDPEEFKALLGRLRRDLDPVGAIEEMMVERVAVCYWRLRRAQIAEVGETRRRLDLAGVECARQRLDTFLADNRLLCFEHVQHRLSTNSHLLTTQIDLLRSILKELENGEPWHQWMRESLIKTFGYNEDSWIAVLAVLVHMLEHGPLQGENHSDIPPPHECMKKIIALLNAQKKRLAELYEAVKLRDELADEAYVMACHLPGEVAVDKLLRYETAIERQMMRALDELRRLQIVRKVRSPVSFPAA